MKDKKIVLIFEFIKSLKKGEVCLNAFANIHNVDIRTVQRYKKDIEEIFDIKLKMVKKGCYIATDFNAFNDILIDKGSIEDFDKLVYLLMMINKNFLKFLGVDEDVVKRYLKEENFFIVKDLPFEEIKNSKIFEEIKKALKYKQYIDIQYDSKNLEEFKDVKPIKIVFAEGNWYLACLTKNIEQNSGFKFLRINYIKNVIRKKETFKRDKEVEEFLQNAQSIWSLYNVSPFEVVLEVDKEVKRFFKVKKFLPSQKEQELENGNLLVKYQITSDMEVLNIVKKWIPYIKIVSPDNLREKFVKLLQESIVKNS